MAPERGRGGNSTLQLILEQRVTGATMVDKLRVVHPTKRTLRVGWKTREAIFHRGRPGYLLIRYLVVLDFSSKKSFTSMVVLRKGFVSLQYP